MIGSMFSGISGLSVHKQRMDVIGNDIANVNTVGFKQSDVTFKEGFINTLRYSLPRLPGMQHGMGAQTAQITRDFSGGALMETGRASNLAISGNGFFVVSSDEDTLEEYYYTRAGDFVLDVPDGEHRPMHLITSDGHRLLGWMGDDGPPNDDDELVAINLRVDLDDDDQVTAYAIGLDGTVRRSVDGAPMEVIGRVAIASPANPEGLDAVGANLYRPTEAAGLDPTKAAGLEMTYEIAGTSGRGQIFQGYLENSNVDMAREFVDMIITQRGFQANSRTIGTSDEMLQELMNMKR